MIRVLIAEVAITTRAIWLGTVSGSVRRHAKVARAQMKIST